MDEFLKVTSSKYYKNIAKFILVAVNVKQKDLSGIFQFFLHHRIFNCVVITQGRMTKLSYNPLTLRFYPIDSSFKTLDENFPDKLQDIHGYKYKITFYELGLPRLKVMDRKAYGPDVDFIETVAKKQNGGVSIQLTNNKMESLNDIERGSADISLNTHVSYANSQALNLIETFDTDGFCALVPLPGIKTYFDFIIKPFDLWTWIFIFLSMICCAITWKLLSASSTANTNSSTYYVYAFISSFLGQIVPFRDHRPMQKLILQLTIMLTFILGTLHQSIMIASITGSHYQPTITKIDELIAGDYSFYVDPLFVAQLNGSEYYQKMSPKISKQLEDINLNYRNLSSQNIAIIMLCSNVPLILDKHKHPLYQNFGASEFYYKLEEKFNTFYLKLLVAPKSIFYERLQEFSLKVFESGIRQHWEVVNPLMSAISSRKLQTTHESDYYLNLADIAPAFYILALGLLISYFAVVIEFVYFFVDNKLRIIKNKPKVSEFGKKTSHKVTHRIIQVRPINQNQRQV